MALRNSNEGCSLVPHYKDAAHTGERIEYDGDILGAHSVQQGDGPLCNEQKLSNVKSVKKSSTCVTIEKAGVIKTKLDSPIDLHRENRGVASF